MTSTEEKVAFLMEKLPEAEESMLLDVLVSCDGDLKQTCKLLGVTNHTSTKQQATLKRFVKSTADNNKEVVFKKRKTDIKGKTIHIYDPQELAELVPCASLHLNVFDPDLADNLLKFLMQDSQNWGKNHLTMFDRQVVSHHTTHTYSDNEKLLAKQNVTYNGRRVSNVRPFDKYMTLARDVVQDITNREIDKRGLAKYQYPGKWLCDFAICNKYNGPSESVGYHSDQMTHIGPHAVISSISLGATREFRLKDRHDREKSTISVHLPHNSLIIMHAGCQEEYKHSIVPLTYALQSHPISGHARLNLTYRMYLAEFSYDVIPKCKCQRPMILRTTISKEKNYKYIWQCPGGNGAEDPGCNLVTYPTFKANF